MIRLPVPAGAIWQLLRAIEPSGSGAHFLAVGGTSDRAPVLRQQLLRGRAEPGAVRFGDLEGAAAYVHVLAGEPGDDDVAVLRRARRAHVPVIAVAFASARNAFSVPYVLATNVVWVSPGEDAPLDAIAGAIAAVLGESGAPLAARVPLLRDPFCEQLLASFARRNGVIAATVWRSRSDLPVLLLNELRLVLRLAQAYDADGLPVRLPELTATVGAAFGLRALARQLLDLAPGAGWALRGGVAYGGTRALGAAARLRFAPASTPPRVATSPAGP
ncbi:MAG: hypothetical protein ACXVRJ_08470 [Gaiellaceae bacterium]